MERTACWRNFKYNPIGSELLQNVAFGLSDFGDILFGQTTLFTVIVAKIIGAALPILAKKIGFDPAVMASPLITTAVDAISLVIYFSVAMILLDF